MPRARDEIVRQIDSIWVITKPRNAVAELASPLEETFILGGTYDLGGPRYAHSCIGVMDSASIFSLHWRRTWIASDSLVLAVAVLSTDQVERSAGRTPRVWLRREVIRLTELKEAFFASSADSGTVTFEFIRKGDTHGRMIFVSRHDVAAAKALVKRARSAARL